jgi:glyoxylase-like metal-dependent hydrolase (beta-lactamase superfamily II)/rhodanese-related sulfurtransferase
VLFQRFFLDGLAQASYLVADEGEAVVVDPRRDVGEYVDCARRHGLRVRCALATHVHADFVAGLRELRAATGATLAMGARFAGALQCDRLRDGDELVVGRVRVRALETPGHTPESVCYLVQAPDAPPRLLSGDTLFIGDVGRPDLVSGQGFTARDMAVALWDSLRAKIAPLPDATEVWPAHGAGSACGSAIAAAASATLGEQRLGNWGLCETDRDAFVDRLIGCLRPPPAYFMHAAELNRQGPRLLAELPDPPELEAAAVERACAAGAVLLDVRDGAAFGRGHWPRALNLGLAGAFEAWCGALVPPRADLVIHAADAAAAASALQRLLRMGYERVAGITRAVPARPEALPQVDVADLFVAQERGERWQVVDVRRPNEFAAGRIAAAVHAELGGSLGSDERLATLARDRPTAVVCEGGYRSSAASHFLAARGFTRLHNVEGGMRAWRAAGLPLERG